MIGSFYFLCQVLCFVLGTYVLDLYHKLLDSPPRNTY